MTCVLIRITALGQGPVSFDVLPKKIDMPRQLRVPLLLIAGVLLAGGIFYGFYSGEENIETASTGFNASSKGFFGWDYSFAEHTFEPDGDAYRAVLIDSGSPGSVLGFSGP